MVCCRHEFWETLNSDEAVSGSDLHHAQAASCCPASPSFPQRLFHREYYTPNREKKSFVKKLGVSKSEFLNFFPESQSEFLNFGCLLPRQVVRNAPEFNLRNYQTLDWAEKNKKFQSLSRQSVFLLIGPGCMLEDLNGRCVKVEQLDENDQVLGDCDRAVPVVSKQIHPKGSHALVVPWQAPTTACPNGLSNVWQRRVQT